ncbi:TonB-dependent receptor [Sphaerotilus sp.]|uniref:TonB-dependent receptor n=1 Tax=Sphaerotilus sp. TaxID=2093942 RepID=UPI0034E26557
MHCHLPCPAHDRLPARRLTASLGALAAGFGFGLAWPAQAGAVDPAPAEAEISTLRKITVKGKADTERGKDSLQTTTTAIGKGQQELRDIPQSITVVTERLIDDRHLDTLKDALRSTAGISFLAAEGGEEDIRLRGLPLQSTGDVFVDGMRDPAFYERDNFFLDRVEVMRGSASMLFGRGSTGGAVNQVTKVPGALDEHQIDVTLGSHRYQRVVGDFNLRTGERAGLRLGVMNTTADNNGAGSSLDKTGLAGAYRWGIGERDEFTLGFSHLDNDNGMNYGLPWIRPTATSGAGETTLLPLDPGAYYGLASDRNAGEATTATASHTHRFGQGVELTSKVRIGRYDRDQRASAIRLCTRTVNAATGAVTNPQCPTSNTLTNFGDATVFTRGTNLKIQDLQTLYAQTDFSGKFKALDMQHEVLAGADFAYEKKSVHAALTVAQGGVVPTKVNTTVGTPDDGASVDESLRSLRVSSQYVSRGLGIYAQDLVQVVPMWKVLAGLRYDRLAGDYDTFTIPAAAVTPVTLTSYRMQVSEWSQRAGVLFQPSERLSFHLSGATSFNTSGDAYSLGASNVDTPPEKAINLELGGRAESQDGRFSARFALFRSTKLNERNTDPLDNLVTLSGQRHAAGAELDLAGRLTVAWEVYGSYLWMPVAKIDVAVPCTASATVTCVQTEAQGDRPSLSPRHSGTFWTTYQLTPTWRIGGGLNARSSQTPNRNPGWAAPKFITGDLMAEYTFSEAFIVKANLSNVTNKLYAESLYSAHYVPGAGRLLQVTGSLKF